MAVSKLRSKSLEDLNEVAFGKAAEVRGCKNVTGVVTDVDVQLSPQFHDIGHDCTRRSDIHERQGAGTKIAHGLLAGFVSAVVTCSLHCRCQPP